MKRNLEFFGLFSEGPTEKYPLQRRLDKTEGFFFFYQQLKKKRIKCKTNHLFN